jgi:hypothetical protein
MRIDAEHFVPVSPAAWWALMEDPAFLAQADAGSGVLREVLRNEPGAGRDGRRLLRVRWTSQRDLPGVVRAVLGAERLSYELVQHLDDARFHLWWEIVPPISRERCQGGGAFWLEAARGGAVRKVSGEIAVRIPLVGGQIEKLLATEIAKGHERNAQAAAAWLARRA